MPWRVLACNHTSYLDGLALSAALPPPLVFIAKKELAAQRVAGPFLRKLGALFVERTDPEAALVDAQTALELARSGKSHARPDQLASSEAMSGHPAATILTRPVELKVVAMPLVSRALATPVERPNLHCWLARDDSRIG